MELQSLKPFELLNNKIIYVIKGGAAKDSKSDDGSRSFAQVIIKTEAHILVLTCKMK